MAIVTFPSVKPSSAKWQLTSNSQVFESPIDGTIQSAELAGAKWEADLTFRNLGQANADALMSFLAKMRGVTGRTNLYNHAKPGPRGTALGTPLVNGGSQTGNTIITDGWNASQTGVLLAGDFIGFGSELHIVVEDANSDVSGNATLTIEPPIKTSPANNAAITVNSPTATMHVIDDVSASYSRGGAPFYSMSIRLREAI